MDKQELDDTTLELVTGGKTISKTDLITLSAMVNGLKIPDTLKEEVKKALLKSNGDVDIINQLLTSLCDDDYDTWAAVRAAFCHMIP